MKDLRTLMHAMNPKTLTKIGGQMPNALRNLKRIRHIIIHSFYQYNVNGDTFSRQFKYI